MINTTVRLQDQYDIRFDMCRILVDAANLSFISALKDRVDVDPDYGKQIAFYKKSYPSVQFLQQNMIVIPVPFSNE